MATTTTRRRPLAQSDDDLVELLELLKDADSVELKLTVPAGGERSAVRALGLDPLDAEIRQVFFFDTPELTLDKAGVVVRARRTQRKGDDSVVKLRPVVPDKLPPELRVRPEFNVEVDAMPGGHVCSASLKGVPKPGRVRAAVLDGQPIRKVFSKEQRALYTEHAPEGIALDDLKVLGPIFVLKLKTYPWEDRKLVTELWLYPDGSLILELSTKTVPSQAFQVAAESRAFLVEKGIDLSGTQQTKTRKALQFFAKDFAKLPAAR